MRLVRLGNRSRLDRAMLSPTVPISSACARLCTPICRMPRWTEVHEFVSSLNHRASTATEMAPLVAGESTWSFEAVPPPIIESFHVDRRDEGDCVHQQQCQRRLSLVRRIPHDIFYNKTVIPRPLPAGSPGSSHRCSLICPRFGSTQVEQALENADSWCSGSRNSSFLITAGSNSRSTRSNNRCDDGGSSSAKSGDSRLIGHSQRGSSLEEEEQTALDFGEEETWQRMMQNLGWGTHIHCI